VLDVELDSADGERTDVVVVSGELDYSTVTYLREQIEGLVADLVLDLSELAFMDSTGIATLIALWRSFEADDRRLVIVVTPGATVQRTLEVRGLAKALPLAESRDAALARLSD
jgi:anti-anti-sigma factor